MKSKPIQAISVCTVTLLMILVVLHIQLQNHEKTITFSIYSGNNWGVPQNFTYAIYDKAVEMYEKENPGVDIDIQLITGTMYDDYSEFFAQRILKGEEPDIFLILEENFNTYASIGILENLDSYLSKDSDFPCDAMYMKAMDAGRYQGKQYSLPISIVPSFLVMNKTLLEENGIELDLDRWSWDQLYHICSQLTLDNDDDGQLDTYGIQGYDWHNAYYTNDENLFIDSGRSIVINDARMMETIGFLKKLHALNDGHIVSERDFENGKVGFKTFNMSEYRAYGTYPYRILKYQNFKWEAIPFPPQTYDRDSSSKLYTVQIGMSSRSKNKKDAISFIKYIVSNEDFQYEVWKGTNTIPANRNVIERVYKENELDGNTNLFDYDLLVDIIDNSYTDPDFRLHSYLDEVITQNMYKFVALDRDSRIDLIELKENIQSGYNSIQ